VVHFELLCLSLREGTDEYIEPLQLVPTSEHGTYPELSCSDIRSHVTSNERLSSRWRWDPNEKRCVVVLWGLRSRWPLTFSRHFSSFIVTSSSPCSQDCSTTLKSTPDASNPQLVLFVPNALILRLSQKHDSRTDPSNFWPTCLLTRRPTHVGGPTGTSCPKITVPHFQDF